MKKGDVNLHTLNNMLQQKVVRKQIAIKIARSGLSLRHWKLAVDRGIRDGLNNLLSEKVGAKVRVTSTKRNIENMFNFLN